MRDTGSMRDSASTRTRYLAIAALAVWTFAAFSVVAVLGGFAGMIVALVLTALVFSGVAAVGVRFEEMAVGVGLLVAGGAWMLFFGVLAFWRGVGWGTGDAFGEPYVVELGVDVKALAVWGAFTLIGLIPLSVGVSFLFGVGPLAKPVSKPERMRGPSRRATLAAGVEALLVVVTLTVAAVVARTVFHSDGSFMSSVSGAPGP